MRTPACSFERGWIVEVRIWKSGREEGGGGAAE